MMKLYQQTELSVSCLAPHIQWDVQTAYGNSTHPLNLRKVDSENAQGDTHDFAAREHSGMGWRDLAEQIRVVTLALDDAAPTELL
jgi:hypothetical protein